MKAKKSFKADLERKKSFFFKLGVVISLSLVLFAFEWKHSKQEFNAFNGDVIDYELDKIDIIDRPEPPKIKIEIPINLSKITLTPNNEKAADINLGDLFNNDTNTVYEPIASRPDIDIIDYADSIIIIPDKTAEFTGGNEKMYSFFAENCNYPVEDRHLNIQGTVYLSFIVEKNGSITDSKIIRSLTKSCDDEAIRVINMMPKWQPAINKGKNVRQKFILPFRFLLN